MLARGVGTVLDGRLLQLISIARLQLANSVSDLDIAVPADLRPPSG